MKKLFYTFAICSALLIGCATIPTPDKMRTAAYSIGAAAGLVANRLEIDDIAKSKIVEIVKIIDMHVPQTNETFAETWTPLVNDFIDRQSKLGNIGMMQTNALSKVLNLLCNGTDYMFSVRFTKVRQCQDLVEVATHGFCAGFLTAFKPMNHNGQKFTTPSNYYDYDLDAYNYLMSVRN